MTIETLINTPFTENESDSKEKHTRGGRPKGAISIVTELRNQLSSHPEYKHQIASHLIDMARLNHPKSFDAIVEITNRLDGKVVESHRIELENPITINFVPIMPGAQITGNGQEGKIDTSHMKQLASPG